MTTLRETAQQALEALQNCANGEDDVLLTRDALAALRAALAEPVQEPVAYSVGRTLHWHDGKGVNDAQLYLAPPQRKPLTDEEIERFFSKHELNYDMVKFARAIKLPAALLLPSALVWLSLAFVLWNWSPETWCEWHRAIFVWVSFMLTVPAVGFVGEIA